MIEAYLNDQRHRQSEELAFDAERLTRKGQLEASSAAYAKAASLEEAVAQEVADREPRERTVLAISAVSLWLKAGKWDDAARCGCHFLGMPHALTPDGKKELAALVDRAWRSQELGEYFPGNAAYAGLEARLLGGTIRKGLAPANVVAERRDVVVPMLYRVAEWRTLRRFRKAGASTFARELEVIEAPALAASYTVRLFVGSARDQQLLPDVPGGPKDVVDTFLRLAAAASEGLPRILSVVGDEAYARAFARGFRDLAADGAIVGSVELSGAPGGSVERVQLAPAIRAALSSALQTGRDTERQLVQEGVLKAVNLRGDAPWLVLELEGRTPSRFRIAKGEQDDTIGPKLNRRVQINGRHVVTEDGESEDWADDVVLLEDLPIAAT